MDDSARYHLRMRAALVLIVLLGGCEDTRRASPRDRRDDDRGRIEQKLDITQGKLDDLQAKLVTPPATLGTGAFECDELIRLTRCAFTKAGAAIPPEAAKAFEDGVAAWTQALADSVTRDATISACKMSLDAGRDGYAASGCY